MTPPQRTTAQNVAWIWGFWKPHRASLVLLFVFTLVSSAITIAYPMVFKVVLDQLYDAAQKAGLIQDGRAVGGMSIPMQTVQTLLIILGAIALGRFLVGFYPAFRARMNLKIDLDVREAVFSRILRKDYRFFNHFAPGDMVTRLMDDISEYPKIAWFSCSGVFRGVESGSRLLFCVGAMLLLEWRLALLALIPLPVMMYIIYRVKSHLTEAAQDQQRAISQTNDMLEKTFSGIRIVKAFSSETGQAAALNRVLQHRIGVQFRVQQLWAMINTLDISATRAGQLVVLALGGVMAMRGEITLGTIYAFYIYLDMLVQPMWDLPNLLVTSRQAFVCIEREEELIQYPVKISHSLRGERLSSFRSLEFNDVRFRYDGDRDAVSVVSFRIDRGEIVALVGPVASGKTTILKLAAGLLAPDEGEIRVNGLPLAAFNHDTFRSVIGYTPQDSLLFSETIRENVSMGRPAEDADAWIRSVLEVAQMDGELSAMKDGIETVLGQKGAKVSGGQRQRISISRALYGRPELMLLDDCTASLDAENEDRLWNGLRGALPDTAVLLVSHRLATIRRADRIVVLDGGSVTDTGTHLELANRCEVYRRFLERAEEREKVLDGSAIEAGG